MSYNVRSTPVADRQISALRGARRKAYDQFEESLARQGCAALDSRDTPLREPRIWVGDLARPGPGLNRNR